MYFGRVSPTTRYAIYALFSFFIVLSLYHILQVLEYSPQLPDVQGFAHRTQAGLKHPIQHLAEKSYADYDAMLASQSNDLISAVEEYRRRYGREPPPGFDQWFQYAAEHGSLIMDEYDYIYEMLEPFWAVEPELLRKAVRTVSTNDPDAIGFVKVENGVLTKEKTGWIADGLMGLLEDVQHMLPNMELMVSGADEPMLLRSTPGHNIDANGDIGHKIRNELTWEDIMKPCSFPNKHDAPAAPLWRTPEVSREVLHGLPFVTNKYDEMDVCKHPEYDTMQDLGRSCAKNDFFLYDGLVPLFSQAAPSTFSDIFFPTVQYWVKGQLPRHDTLSWADKKNALYWKGSTTSGWALETNDFRHFIRHRFVEFVQGLANPTYKLLQQSRLGYWSSMTTKQLPEDKYNVHFSAVIQCKPEAVCQKEKDYFKLGAYGPKNESSNYRFVMDIDGNTFANRFYRSLSSNSVVLKQTGFKEWHDERLFPWVHYVPVSISNEELPEIMRYLSETDEGQALAEQIAGRARHYVARVLRRVDASVFTYRLMIEYARVMRDDRDDAAYVAPEKHA